MALKKSIARGNAIYFRISNVLIFSIILMNDFHPTERSFETLYFTNHIFQYNLLFMKYYLPASFNTTHIPFSLLRSNHNILYKKGWRSSGMLMKSHPKRRRVFKSNFMSQSLYCQVFNSITSD